MMSEAAHDLDDGETRHESREAEAPEHEEVQLTKHASRSDSQAQQPDLTSRGGVLGECVYARCPHHRPTTTNTAQPQRFGALLPMPSCLGIGGSRQGHPRYIGARTTGRPWVAHTNAQRAKRTCHDAYSRQSNTQVFRQAELEASLFRFSSITMTSSWTFWHPPLFRCHQIRQSTFCSHVEA